MLGLLVLAGLPFFAAHRVDERDAARRAIAARAYAQHTLVLAAMTARIYSDYVPTQIVGHFP
jgi:hypothetical protein